MRSSAPLACTCLALAACHDDPPAAPETAAACPITEPVRLAAAPAGFAPLADLWYGLHVFGDHIFYTFDRLDDPRRVYWRLDRCTGELAPYPSLAPGLHNPYTIATPAGRVVYATDALGQQFIVDRLDVPGADEPIPVPGLPEGTGFHFPGASSRPYTRFNRPNPAPPEAIVFTAAGLGGHTHGVYTHAGDRDAPALLLAEDAVATTVLADALLVHHDSGALRRVDPLTGDGEPVLTGVRHFDLLSGPKIVWQEIGDDIAEPVHLYDLESGDDRVIAVNDFSPRSWSRDPERHGLGSWSGTSDGAAIALVGPDDLVVAAVATDTAESLDIPAHIALRGAPGGHFGLVLAEDPERVEALWDPRTGDVREWYRGPNIRPWLYAVDGDRVDYFLPDTDSSDTGSLWRVDLRTGAAAKLLGRSDRHPAQLDDTRYFVSFATTPLPGPPFNGSTFLIAYASDLKLVDSATGVCTPIADDISAFAIIPDEGLVYLDAHGPEPGIWAYPLPFE